MHNSVVFIKCSNMQLKLFFSNDVINHFTPPVQSAGYYILLNEKNKSQFSNLKQYLLGRDVFNRKFKK